MPPLGPCRDQEGIDAIERWMAHASGDGGASSTSVARSVPRGNAE
jgi:hypothetical protein